MVLPKNILRITILAVLSAGFLAAHIGMLYRLALILEQKGDMEGAIDASQSSLEAVSSASTELREEYTKLNKQLLSRLKH